MKKISVIVFLCTTAALAILYVVVTRMDTTTSIANTAYAYHRTLYYRESLGNGESYCGYPRKPMDDMDNKWSYCENGGSYPPPIPTEPIDAIQNTIECRVNVEDIDPAESYAEPSPGSDFNIWKDVETFSQLDPVVSSTIGVNGCGPTSAALILEMDHFIDSSTSTIASTTIELARAALTNATATIDWNLAIALADIWPGAA